MPTREQIESIVDGILPEIVQARHALHARPELACEERETAAFIRSALASTRLSLLEPFLGTDVVGMLRGGGPGPNVTLRADIDALPLREESELPYRSEREGIMHACGHDGHTAMLLGAARVLSELSHAFNGSVRFVFQPGEEVRGAGRDLVEAGALKDPAPSAVFALHVWPDLPVGSLAGKPGIAMAASDFFTVTVIGKGGHGSRPEAAKDPILVGARIVEGLQSIVSRRVSPLEPVVVSVCRFTAGTNGNVIPGRAELEGTVRYLKPELGPALKQAIEQIVKGSCDAAGADYRLKYDVPYIPLTNDPAMTALAARVARDTLGPDAWVDLTEPTMGGEDFAYYLTDHPGAMLRLGNGPDSAPLHNPRFDFNDGALRSGILFLISVALAAGKESDSGGR